ncbi:MAG: DJ-1/PfpI family protein [bacterium]
MMKKVKLLGFIGFLILGLTVSPLFAASFLEVAKQTGIEITKVGDALVWKGPGGVTKPKGPLAGKKIGAIAASEFSDFQAYFLASYIGEFGGKLDFLLVDWVEWKFTRPNIAKKGVRGMWDLSLDPIPVMGTGKCNAKKLGDANPKEYDAIIVMGGHSADVMVTEDKVINFIKEAHGNGAVMGAIGAGSMPFIRAGIMKGKKATGDANVEFMIKKIGTFVKQPVVVDGKLITAGDTVDTPAFVRALCKAFDPNFNDPRKGAMKGKKMLVIAGEDFEDIELAVPVMEYLYRGASVTLATFPAPMKSRPGGLNIVQGNFGMTIPFQEIPLKYYKIKPLAKVTMEEFDALQIPGAFCPWNMIAARTPLEFLKKADAAKKILAYICHGPIPIAAADLIKGKKVAGWLASKDAVEIMGGEYNWDWAAVVDGNHVSGRTPPEIPEFLDAINVALEKK